MEIRRNSAIALRCHTMVAITKRGSSISSREEVSLVVLAFCLAQTDTRPATVFGDELDSCLF
jgi:hypothetical protein